MPTTDPDLTSRTYRLLWSSLVWGLFALACMTPAVYLDEGGHACTAIRMGSPPGVVALLLGWYPPYCVPWAANLLLLAGSVLLLVRRFRAAAWVGGAGALLATSTWAFGFPRLLIGYYFWQASFLALAAAAVMLARARAHPPAGAARGDTVPTA